MILGRDWPRFQCNPARTGWTPDSPEPPYEIVYFIDLSPEPIGQVQPIIYKDVMYVPTLLGRLYAFEAETGKRLWVKEGVGTVIRTPSAGGGLIVMANAEGTLHAVRASDGETAWRRDLGFSISASPCIDEKKIYIGTRRGDFYCLSLADREVVWKRKLEHYVWASVAVADGRVYVPTDGELHLYCLDASSGKVLWKTPKLPGAFIRDGCPVVTDGKVFLWTMPQEYYMPPEPPPYEVWGPHKRSDFMKYYRILRGGRLSADFLRANEQPVRALTDNPLNQTMFAFDARTGERPYVVGAYRLLAGWLHTTPPSAVDSQGKLQVPVPFGMSRFGRLDPHTGQICQIIVGPLLPENIDKDSGRGRDGPDGFGTNSDENHASSCGGDWVFWKHWSMGALANPMSNTMAYNVKSNTVIRMLFPHNQFRNAPRIKASIGTDWRLRTKLRDSTAYSSFLAASIWKNFLFHHGGSQIVAIRGRGKE